MADTAPLYPEVEARRKLSKKQRAEVILRQRGLCAGCGIKPRHGWEMDHDKALWKGDTKQSDLDTWQAFGSRKDCRCHKEKTAAEAGERAKMYRVRTDAEKHASIMRMKGVETPAAIRRAKIAEKLAKGNRALKSRPLIETRESRSPSASFGGGRKLAGRGFDRTRSKGFDGKIRERT